MSQGPIISRAYGFNGYVNVFPAPIVTSRDPVNGANGDTGLNGQVWVNTSTPAVFFMANANTSTWVDVSGGTGVFAALTVNPGPTALTGQFTLNAAGNATNINSGGGAVNISNDTVANTTTIGNVTGNTAVNINAGTGGVGVVTTNSTFSLATGTGIINIGNNATASTINIGANGGAGTQKIIHIGDGAAAVNTVFVGTQNGASALTLAGGVGANVSMVPAISSTASPTNAVTMNARVGRATFTGFTTASAGNQAFVITNSNVIANSGVFVTVQNTSSGNDGQMTLTSIVANSTAHTLTINTTNNGTQALDGNVIITFWVIS